MKRIYTGVFAFLLTISAFAQEKWTEEDRAYLLQDLKRTKDLLINETNKLSEAQWDFKESPDRWSIRQIVEHINTWELLMTHEISRALSAGPQPALSENVKPDSVYAGFILEEKEHITTDYTKPFTYSVPMGLVDGKTSIAWFLKTRGESIQFVSAATEDLRNHYSQAGRPNVHQRYITLSGHTERHVRQIKKVKQHPKYPR
jgi:hypothetical protein